MDKRADISPVKLDFRHTNSFYLSVNNPLVVLPAGQHVKTVNPQSMLVEENLTLEFEPNAGWDSRIHIARCGEMVRAYLIVCQRFLLVYDTLLGPRSGAWLREQADRLAGQRPIIVVNSHADWDHYFGNQCFDDLTILGTHLCRERILTGVGQAELDKKRQDHPDDFLPVRLCAPNLAVTGETLLDGGDLSLQLLPTIGHRPDHLALYIPELKTLFPGDCVEDPIPLVDEDSTITDNTVEELALSLQAMLALNPTWVLANHAPPENGIRRLQENLRYLKDLQKSALNADSLETFLSERPPNPTWGDYYQQSHRAHLRMAWQQRKSLPR